MKKIVLPPTLNTIRVQSVHSFFLILSLFVISVIAGMPARAELSTGLWANYRYVADSTSGADDRDSETLGDIQGEALILYLDDKAKDSHWSVSAEARFGPGAFTDPANNSTGDNFALHKAWIGYTFNESTMLKIGKSQVPFGWKTVNFWPGDMLQAGYGDQMDVGVKLSSQTKAIDYDLAYYHADDWGESSTDTVDDNGHWGSSTTYRKVKTVVANAALHLSSNHTLALSAQTGALQDLTGINPENPVDGHHTALALYYLGNFEQFNIKAEVMQTMRSLPGDYAAANSLDEDIENARGAFEVGYSHGPWYWYFDATWATADEQTDNSVDDVMAFAPGVSFDYGPGWFYFEALSQDGWIGRDGDIGDGDFAAIYLSADYYF